MEVFLPFSRYFEAAMAVAEYEKFEDGTYGGRIPPCVGVIAFGGTLHECGAELRSTLEDRVLVGLKLGHPLPVIDQVVDPFQQRVLNPPSEDDAAGG